MPWSRGSIHSNFLCAGLCLSTLTCLISGYLCSSPVKPMLLLPLFGDLEAEAHPDLPKITQLVCGRAQDLMLQPLYWWRVIGLLGWVRPSEDPPSTRSPQPPQIQLLYSCLIVELDVDIARHRVATPESRRQPLTKVLSTPGVSLVSMWVATARWKYLQWLLCLSEVLLGGNIKEWLKGRTIMLRSFPDIALIGECGNPASSP